MRFWWPLLSATSASSSSLAMYPLSSLMSYTTAMVLSNAAKAASSTVIRNSTPKSCRRSCSPSSTSSFIDGPGKITSGDKRPISGTPASTSDSECQAPAPLSLLASRLTLPALRYRRFAHNLTARFGMEPLKNHHDDGSVHPQRLETESNRSLTGGDPLPLRSSSKMPLFCHGSLIPSNGIVRATVRHFSTNNIFDEDENARCWRCDKPMMSDSVGSTKEKTSKTSPMAVVECVHCHAIQPLKNDINYFHLFQIETRYDIDLEQLRKKYLRLQQNMHPDMNINRSNTEMGYSADNASIINDAYKILRDPYQRAAYILKTVYMITIDEENVDTEPELLLEIMELNEDVELAGTDKDSLMAVSDQVRDAIADIGQQLKRALDTDGNGSEARNLVIKYSYYQTVSDKLKAKLMALKWFVLARA